jgi:hypothetical protein
MSIKGTKEGGLIKSIKEKKRHIGVYEKCGKVSKGRAELQSPFWSVNFRFKCRINVVHERCLFL